MLFSDLLISAIFCTVVLQIFNFQLYVNPIARNGLHAYLHYNKYPTLAQLGWAGGARPQAEPVEDRECYFVIFELINDDLS